MPDLGQPGSIGSLSGDALSDFTSRQRELFYEVAATDEDELRGLLDGLTDSDLRDLQRMVGSAAHQNWSLRHAVSEAVLRRPHRGCWPPSVT
jgi:hypothetical protein